MHRDCIDKIIAWNHTRKRKPLLLMGARQVGKTWLMEEFARREYPGESVLVNFMRRRSLCEQLSKGDIDPASLVRLIQTATGKRVVPGRTLLILDEIQECPSAL
ncbi:MAG: AAA family ATPase, partial [Kiritimatiellae bacterium]|nr:AAA family ATPase [Kiritimatiellia bacterium]